jgi:DNA repair protein RecN (Recombination protein N)
MLTELSIENFALVDKLRLEFGPGLNILTGETGAGKSILMDAMGVVLGERAGAEVIRHGADRARVEAVFAVGGRLPERLAEALDAAGVEAEDDGLLLLSRDLSAAGKGSTVRINGRPATVGMLKAIGDALVDIHGQHEHQSLLDARRHGDILDAWCGPELLGLKAAVADAYEQAQAVAHELAALRQDARERARTLDLLQFQRDEIDQAAPRPEEEEALMNERLRLASAEKRFEAAAGAYAALHGGSAGTGRRAAGTSALEGGALEGLTTAVAEIEHAARLDERLAPLLESLRNALYVAEDAARDVRGYRDEIEFNPERLEEIEARLDTLRTLKRKYGDTLEEVLRYREEIGARLDTLENAEERIAALEVASGAATKTLEARCAKLTAARKKAAKPFAESVTRELADLAMTATRFSGRRGAPRRRTRRRGSGRVPPLAQPRRAPQAARPDRVGRRDQPRHARLEVRAVARRLGPDPGLRRDRHRDRRAHGGRPRRQARPPGRVRADLLHHTPSPDRVARRVPLFHREARRSRTDARGRDASGRGRARPGAGADARRGARHRRRAPARARDARRFAGRHPGGSGGGAGRRRCRRRLTLRTFPAARAAAPRRTT